MFSETYFNVQFVAAVICRLLLAGCLSFLHLRTGNEWKPSTSSARCTSHISMSVFILTSFYTFCFPLFSASHFTFCFWVQSFRSSTVFDRISRWLCVCFKPFLWFVLCFASFPACDLRPSGSVFCRNVTSFYNSKCKTLRVGQNIRLCAAALGSLQVVVLSVKCPWINKKSKRLKNICFISSDDS